MYLRQILGIDVESAYAVAAATSLGLPCYEAVRVEVHRVRVIIYISVYGQCRKGDACAGRQVELIVEVIDIFHDGALASHYVRTVMISGFIFLLFFC